MITMKIKSMFFDRLAVIHALDPAKRKALSRAGAFIRTSAKGSIRKRKGISRPGNPPHSHQGDLRRLILFGYDRSTDSVVIGPVGFKGSPVPHALEYGGPSVKAAIRHRRGRARRVKIAITVKPRPFMGPALQKELKNIPRQFRNSVRREP